MSQNGPWKDNPNPKPFSATYPQFSFLLKTGLEYSLNAASVCVQLYGGDLESDFSQFQDWLQIFPLYKGRANIEGDEEDEEERLMGKYKVLWLYSCVSDCHFTEK